MRSTVKIVLGAALLLFCYYLQLLPSASVPMLRFIPTLAILVTMMVGVWLMIRERGWNRGAITHTIFVWTVYVAFHSFFIPNAESGTIRTLIQCSYWGAFFLSLRIATNRRIVQMDRMLVKWFIAIFFITVLGFLFSIRTSANYDTEELIGENSVFYPLLCLPWIVMANKRRLRMIMVGLIVICAILSLKRSAVLIVALALIVFFYREFLWNRKGKFFKLIAIILFIGGAYYLFVRSSDSFNNVVSRFENISEDRGSGREFIYQNVFRMIEESTLSEYCWGHGFNMTVICNNGSSAHNDFLEVFFDYGIVGLVIYLWLHIGLIGRMIGLHKIRSTLFTPYLISYLMFFVISMVSHLIIYPTYFVILAAFWAYVESAVISSKNSPYEKCRNYI